MKIHLSVSPSKILPLISAEGQNIKQKRLNYRSPAKASQTNASRISVCYNRSSRRATKALTLHNLQKTGANFSFRFPDVYNTLEIFPNIRPGILYTTSFQICLFLFVNSQLIMPNLPLPTTQIWHPHDLDHETRPAREMLRPLPLARFRVILLPCKACLVP
jgi:hypothetical protein